MLTVFTDIFASAGGGGSGGGDGGGGLLALPVILASVIASWYVRRKKIKVAERSRRLAELKDPSWSDELIYAQTEYVFHKFQSDWGSFNLDDMHQYLTPRYLKHVTLVLKALKQMNRQNIMTELKLKDAKVLGVHDHPVDELDRFDVEVVATGKDLIINTLNKEKIYGFKNKLQELWHFEREGKTWKLDRISQLDKSGFIPTYEETIDEEYFKFATDNNFFYNADFGWQLLPLRGTLFNLASFGHSDINHHIIGEYRGRVVQFFDYIPFLSDKFTLGLQIKRFFIFSRRMDAVKYTVAHVTLPKDYGNILVERRGILSAVGIKFKPKDTNFLSISPTVFAKKYDVFASDVEQVTSFELLHPGYIEKMIDIGFKAHIEVIGRDLYLYSSDKEVDYQSMLDLLKQAFDELKM